jgi:hypothetical protein
MSAPESFIRTVPVSFPTRGLAQIDLCAQRSGLPTPKFYTVALTLGARIQVISLEPVASLPESLRREAARSVNTSITSQSLLQIVAPEKPALQTAPPPVLEGQVAVDLPADVADGLDQVARMTEIESTKLYGLALATGVQLLASSLTPESSVPIDLLVRASEGPILPEFLAQALMNRQQDIRSRRGTPPSD